MNRLFRFAFPAVLWAAAAQEAAPIGKVVKAEGQWRDQARGGASVGPGYEVRANSLLERKQGTHADKDRIWIEPRGGGQPVRYECGNGMTCVGPLVLCRIPANPTSIAVVNRFLDWIKREECLGADYANVKATIHRAPTDSRPAILLAPTGRVTAAQLFGGEVPKGIETVEFCRVRPGTLCPETVKAVKVGGRAAPGPISLAPGFYKAVVIEDERRTQDQWYILAVADEATFQRLNGLYAEAARETNREASEDSISRSIAYLYYLSETAAHGER